MQPEAGKVGTEVKMATAGIIQAVNDLDGITIKFGDAPTSSGSITATTTTSFGVLLSTRVPPEAAGEVDIAVSTPSGKPSIWPNFKVLPEIPEGQHLVGRHRQPVPVQTRGITGLGPQLHGLTATIAAKKADVALANGGELQVTLPADAPTGPAQLRLVTPGGEDHTPITVDPPSSGGSTNANG